MKQPRVVGTVTELGFQERIVAAALRAARNYGLAAAPEPFTERPLQVSRHPLQPAGRSTPEVPWHKCLPHSGGLRNPDGPGEPLVAKPSARPYPAS